MADLALRAMSAEPMLGLPRSAKRGRTVGEEAGVVQWVGVGTSSNDGTYEQRGSNGTYAGMMGHLSERVGEGQHANLSWKQCWKG